MAFPRSSRLLTRTQKRAARGRGLLVALATAGAITTGPGALPAGATSGGLGEMVRSFCLSAFQSEMAQAGKTPPAGMASFACSCVADRITAGSSLDTARGSCREETARRFSI
jgi:hypothetical protein